MILTPGPWQVSELILISRNNREAVLSYSITTTSFPTSTSQWSRCWFLDPASTTPSGVSDRSFAP